jgi:nucleoside-diphosphate-sugar epimerase
MKVLIIGGTGVISRAITAELLTRGHEPTLFTRGKRQLSFAKDVRQIIGDRNDRVGFGKLFETERFDVVIDMISFTADEVSLTVETFAGRVQQIIVCSSSLAYKRPYRSIPIREDAEELCDTLTPQFPRPLDKAGMERYLQEQGRAHNQAITITIIRPSFTLGAGTSAFGILRQNYGVVDRIRKGKPVVMSGDGLHPWTYTFAPDLAKAFVGAVGNPATYGQHYHATSEERTLWQDAYLEIGKILGKEVHLFHMSSEALLHAAPKMCAHLYYEKSHVGAFDNSKIRRDIPDFKPAISLNEGMRSLIDWYEAEACIVDPVKDALEDKLFAAHSTFLTQIENLYVD